MMLLLYPATNDTVNGIVGICLVLKMVLMSL